MVVLTPERRPFLVQPALHQALHPTFVPFVTHAHPRDLFTSYDRRRR